MTVYLLSRFSLSLLYRPSPGAGELPSVAVVIPAMNEEDGIGPTLASLFALDYPQHLLIVFAVDDGSTDAHLAELQGLRRAPVPDLHAHPLLAQPRQARGDGGRHPRHRRRDPLLRRLRLDARAGRAARDRAAVPRPAGGRRDAATPTCSTAATNLLTRMQQVRYFVAFRVVKAAESVFGAVTCARAASPPTAARRSARRAGGLGGRRRFLGREATFGDDRSLTNALLRNWRVVYQSTAHLRHDRAGDDAPASSCSRCAGRRAGRASR